MKKVVKILCIILVIIIILGLIFFIVDYNKVKNQENPIFCIKSPKGVIRDGGTIEYLGLGYKVIDFNTLSGYDEIKIGTWMMKYNDFYDEIKEKDDIYNKKLNLLSLPKEITPQELAERGYFVYDCIEDKLYNKDILDEFIKNTEMNALNRISDEIIIVVYNINGNPKIYDLEYRSDINKYILITDTTKLGNYNAEDGSIIPKEIVVNDDIPGEIYGITLIEYPGVNAASISLTVYDDIDYNNKQYKNIEIARYLLDPNF